MSEAFDRSFEAPGLAPSDDVARRVDTSLTELLFRFPARVWGNLVNAGLVALIVRDDVPPTLVLAWFGLTAVVTAARYALCMAYEHRHSEADRPGLWVIRFAVGCALSGALWGAASLIVWLTPNVTLHVFLAFVIAGMSAAAAALDYAHPPSVYGYLLLMVLPFAASVFAVGGGMHLAMGGMALLFMLLLLIQTRVAHSVLVDSLRLREENRHLVSVLVASRDALEQRVKERTAELTRINAALQREMAAHQETSGRLHEAQKMQALGQLTGGIAHDFNNLLGVIIGNLDLLALDLQRHPRKTYIDKAIEAAQIGATLTRRLLAFGRRQLLQPVPTDANAMIGDLLELIADTLGTGVTVETRLAAGLKPCIVDRAQLESALLNLAINARDAMPDGGRIVIATDLVTRLAVADGDGDFGPGEYVAISVGDTGVGMSPEVQRQAFEPFFTTKDIGQGTGLGLSMVYGFVKQSRGHVTIDSEVDRGTTITLFLPVTQPEAVGLA